jgi:hypothetical protein
LQTEGSHDIGKPVANRNCEKNLFNELWDQNPTASAVGAVNKKNILYDKEPIFKK